MLFGKRKLLTAFLEKDNLKLLAFEVSGKSVTRTFGGQISFTANVVREAFVADPVKFCAQVKMALSQKPEVLPLTEVVLFLPPDKTFFKAMPASDEIDSFVRSLPYFKEELLIDTQVASGKSHDPNALINHFAFEKKLVEDLERPFLESGKKILCALSNVQVLVSSYTQQGKYLFLISFEKDCTALAMQDGVILDMATIPKEVFAGRLNEFRLGKNFADIKTAFSLGAFEAGVLDRIRTEQGLSVSDLAGSDIYDLIVGSYSSGGIRVDGYSGFLSGIKEKLPNQKLLFLVGAAIVGFVLVLVVARNLTRISLPGFGGGQKTEVKKTLPPTSAPAPVPEAPTPKPADFKVRVLNGTTVAGEAGRAGEAIAALGFDVTETKNATVSGFEATRLRSVSGVPKEIIDQLNTALLGTYESVSLESLVDDTVKIEVIVGKKK